MGTVADHIERELQPKLSDMKGAWAAAMEVAERGGYTSPDSILDLWKFTLVAAALTNEVGVQLINALKLLEEASG